MVHTEQQQNSSVHSALMPGPIPLVGCGILKNEVNFLIRKNNWPFKTHFLCSSLHIDFEKLEKSLIKALNHYGNGPKAVIYGTCHPCMDDFIKQGNAQRTRGQNCVEHLLGKEQFDYHLERGAFFIMDDWASRWDFITGLAFGGTPEITREIFSAEHTYLLGLETPCSGNFRKKANEISEAINLPLKWLTVSLDHLEKNLTETLERVKAMGNE